MLPFWNKRNPGSRTSPPLTPRWTACLRSIPVSCRWWRWPAGPPCGGGRRDLPASRPSSSPSNFRWQRPAASRAAPARCWEGTSHPGRCSPLTRTPCAGPASRLRRCGRSPGLPPHWKPARSIWPHWTTWRRTLPQLSSPGCRASACGRRTSISCSASGAATPSPPAISPCRWRPGTRSGCRGGPVRRVLRPLRRTGARCGVSRRICCGPIMAPDAPRRRARLTCPIRGPACSPSTVPAFPPAPAPPMHWWF